MRTRRLALGLYLPLAIACHSTRSEVDVDSGSSPGKAADAGKDSTASRRDASPDASIEYKVTAYDGPTQAAAPARVPVRASLVSNRADVRQLLFAAGEMQISGEPFASGFAARNLGDYDRNALPPDQYLVNFGTIAQQSITDLFGFSTAVESYEYSKYYMNMVVEETTAGVSLANGPVVAMGPGATAQAQLVLRMNDLLTSAGSNLGGGATLPAPKNNATNYLGLPGLWPSFAPFADFDPAMQPAGQDSHGCSFVANYRDVVLAPSLPYYECDYNTTHLTNLRPVTPGQSHAPSVGARVRDVEGGAVGDRLRREDPRLGGDADRDGGATRPHGHRTGEQRRAGRLPHGRCGGDVHRLVAHRGDVGAHDARRYGQRGRVAPRVAHDERRRVTAERPHSVRR